MANVLIEESTMRAIADAIRAKLGTTDTLKPSEMASAITEITGGGDGGGDIVAAPFAEASWDEIASIAESGEAHKVYAIGDTKNILMTSPYDGSSITVSFHIIGFNHDDLADGSGKAGITIASTISIHSYMMWGSISSTEGYVGPEQGWVNCTMRSFGNANISTILGAEVAEHVKTVVKLSDLRSDTTPLESHDKLWPLSISEVSTAHSNYGNTYEYFEVNAPVGVPDMTSGSAGLGIGSSPYGWALRTLKDGDSYKRNDSVKADGGFGAMALSTSAVMCFCI